MKYFKAVSVSEWNEKQQTSHIYYGELLVVAWMFQALVNSYQALWYKMT